MQAFKELYTNGKSNFKIKPATRKDMSKISNIVRSSAEWYRKFVAEKDMSEHDPDEKWEAENYKKRDFYIGYDGDEVVGTVSTQKIKDYTYLGYVYLDAKHVGKGYGHKLMNFAEEVSKMMNRKGMILIAHPEAKWAVKAYKKYGFDCIAKTKKEVLAWNSGSLEPYYEEGFQLYEYKHR